MNVQIGDPDDDSRSSVMSPCFAAAAHASLYCAAAKQKKGPENAAAALWASCDSDENENAVPRHSNNKKRGEQDLDHHLSKKL